MHRAPRAARARGRAARRPARRRCSKRIRSSRRERSACARPARRCSPVSARARASAPCSRVSTDPTRPAVSLPCSARASSCSASRSTAAESPSDSAAISPVRPVSPGAPRPAAAARPPSAPKSARSTLSRRAPSAAISALARSSPPASLRSPSSSPCTASRRGSRTPTAMLACLLWRAMRPSLKKAEKYFSRRFSGDMRGAPGLSRRGGGSGAAAAPDMRSRSAGEGRQARRMAGSGRGSGGLIDAVWSAAGRRRKGAGAQVRRASAPSHPSRRSVTRSSNSHRATRKVTSLPVWGASKLRLAMSAALIAALLPPSCARSP